MAEHLSRKQLNGIYIPTEKREDLREITRLRASFMKDKTRIANQIKSLLHLHGLITAYDERKVSEKWIKDLSKLELSSGLQYSLKMYVDMWLHYNEKIKEISLKMKEQATEDSAIDKVYQSAPGIGPTSARVLANELDDMQHFTNDRQLSKYLGFTPCEHSSGEHVRMGHITKQGKPYLRKILVQAAWTAIRHDKELEKIFERIAFKAGAKRAIIAIARKLIGRVRACFRTNTLYKSPTREPILPNRELDKNKQAISCAA
jgi:transposase